VDQWEEPVFCAETAPTFHPAGNGMALWEIFMLALVSLSTFLMLVLLGLAWKKRDAREDRDFPMIRKPFKFTP